MAISISKTQISVVTVLTAVAFLLTCIAVGSPGWESFDTKVNGTNVTVTIQYSLYYARYCWPDRCDVVGRAELLTEERFDNRLQLVQMRVASVFLRVTIPIVLLVSVLALEVWTLRTRSWKLSFTTFCMVATSIAATLQWYLVVSESVYMDTTSISIEDPKVKYMDTLPNGETVTYVSIHFPWCVLVYGVAAILLTAVALYFTHQFLITAQAPETTTRSELHEMPATQYVLDNQLNQDSSKTVAN